MQQREHHRVVHELQAGVVARDQVRHRDPEQFTEDGPQFRQAVQAAVVAGVRPVRIPIGIGSRQRQQAVGQIELLRRRFTAGQVERQPLARSAV